jgi:hypothetical protein
LTALAAFKLQFLSPRKKYVSGQNLKKKKGIKNEPTNKHHGYTTIESRGFKKFLRNRNVVSSLAL